MSNWSELDYIRTVDAIAEEALKEYPDDEGDRSQYIHESVDSNEYVIYYSANEIALRASQNEPDDEEVRYWLAGDADWRTIRTLATCMAMEDDVNESMERQRKERTDGKICRIKGE